APIDVRQVCASLKTSQLLPNMGQHRARLRVAPQFDKCYHELVRMFWSDSHVSPSGTNVRRYREPSGTRGHGHRLLLPRSCWEAISPRTAPRESRPAPTGL